MAHTLVSKTALLYRTPFARPQENRSDLAAFPRGALTAIDNTAIAIQAAPDDTGLLFNITPGDEFAIRVAQCTVSITASSSVNDWHPQGQFHVTNGLHARPGTLGPVTSYYEMSAQGYGQDSGNQGSMVYNLTDPINEIFLPPDGLSLSFDARFGNDDAAAQPTMTARIVMYMFYYDIEQYYSVFANIQNPVAP